MKNAQKDRIIAHIQDTYAAEEEHLWAQYPNYSVFRHPMSQKWYAIIMDIPQSKLGLEGEQTVDVLDVKCSPVMIGSLLPEKGFFPAYHMNKKSWISILLDGTVSDEEIALLLDMSYDSVAPKRRKKNPKYEEE